MLARLGSGAFETITGEVVNVSLLSLSVDAPFPMHMLHTIDVSSLRSIEGKAMMLHDGPLQIVSQAGQLKNPDARLTLSEAAGIELLQQYADGLNGITTTDYACFGRCFWESSQLLPGWTYQQSTVSQTVEYGGREHVLWLSLLEREAETIGASIRNRSAWGLKGVGISQMSLLPATLTTGECFDNNTAVILPKDPAHLPAIWAFCSLPEFNAEVRRIDQKTNVTNATLVKVPFNFDHWQAVAKETGPLPEPNSNDPTQWLFKGNPACSTAPLQVAVARLLGYNWPELEDDGLGELADEDEIVPLPPMSGELSAVERLRALLARTCGDAWSHLKEEELLAAIDFAGKSLDVWLRDGFFKQHCRLFHNRPFIWHIWDGRRDGFSVLVNYHKLDKRLLEKLTYTYVGDWIARQQESVRRGEDGADARLIAIKALQDKLKLILEGEPPYDIYVRWKQLQEQPVGWEPDVNDGVRLNIRPFMTAGVLRAEPNIKWGIDRGKNPDGSARDNDIHLSLKDKLDARKAAV